jgi:hypothetical protein
VVPLHPGLSTELTPFDTECRPHALAAVEGADETDALLAS